MWTFVSVASTNMTEGKTGHGLSTSETDNEMNLSVKIPLSVIEEVKETEMKDVVEDNIAAAAEYSHSENSQD